MGLIYSSLLQRLVDQKDRTREEIIAIVLEICIDQVFMAAFYQHAVSPRSVSHIRSVLNSTSITIEKLLKGIALNQIELVVIGDFKALIKALMYDQYIPRVFNSTEQIELLFSRVPMSVPESRVIESCKFVLAIANQIDYSSSKVIVPHIRINDRSDPTVPYFKIFYPVEVIFNLKKTNNLKPDQVWYRIYEGLKLFPDTSNDSIEQICFAINIGTMPDAISGIGLNKFMYEDFVSSLTTRRYMSQIYATIYDLAKVFQSLIRNNPWITTSEEISKKVGSLEADFTDSVSPEEEKSGGAEQEPKDDTTKIDQKDATDDKGANDQSEDDSTAKDDLTDTTDSGAPDKSETTETPDDNSSNDDQDNTSDSKPKLLGLELVLPKNETLDDYLYKLTVAKYIDDTIKYNHDGLNLETVTALTKWKSLFLFLTAAEQTKTLLSELKIKLK